MITKQYDVYYGLDEQRIKSIYTENGTVQKTRYYFGSYERTIKNNVIEEVDYIFTPAGLAAMRMYNDTEGLEKIYYLHTDNLGSIQAITDESKNTVSSYYYTPWGGRVLLSGVNITDRGYTFHEHLEPFGLINMNGRVYDPTLARFLSPDPYIQAPDYTQNFNRYSYCYNNPFKYTDPSGEFFIYILPNISWSPNGGLSIGLSIGVGIPGILSAQVSVGYGFQNGNLSITGGVSAGGFYAYGGYDTKAGLIGGAGYGFGSINGWTSNIASVGVNYSQKGGFSANAFGFQYNTQNGLEFDPSVGVSYRMEYYSKSSIAEISSAMMGVREREFAEIGTNQQKDALLKNNEVNLKDFYVDKVEMENLDFPEQMDGYRRWDDGIITNPDEAIIGGVTYMRAGWNPKSTIYMSPFNTSRNFLIALNHEFIHSWQWAKFGHKISKTAWEALKEPAAYTYTNRYFPYFEKQIQYNGIHQLLRYWLPSNLVPVPSKL